MQTVTLGSTGITVNKNGFGALPIQRVSDDYAVMLLKKAYAGGVRFFDTARMYSDSEHKVGLAFGHMREKVFISTKTGATTVEKCFKTEVKEKCVVRRGTLTSTSSTTLPSAPNPATAPVCTKPCWKPKPRAKSATSASPTIVSPLPGKPSNPACTKPSSSPSAIWPQSLILIW